MTLILVTVEEEKYYTQLELVGLMAHRREFDIDATKVRLYMRPNDVCRLRIVGQIANQNQFKSQFENGFPVEVWFDYPLKHFCDSFFVSGKVERFNMFGNEVEMVLYSASALPASAEFATRNQL